MSAAPTGLFMIDGFTGYNGSEHYVSLVPTAAFNTMMGRSTFTFTSLNRRTAILDFLLSFHPEGENVQNLQFSGPLQLAEFDSLTVSALGPSPSDAIGISLVGGTWNLSFIWQHEAFPFLTPVDSYYFGPGTGAAPAGSYTGSGRFALNWNNVGLSEDKTLRFVSLITLGSGGDPSASITFNSSTVQLQVDKYHAGYLSITITGELTSEISKEEFKIWLDVDGQGHFIELHSSSDSPKGGESFTVSNEYVPEHDWSLGEYQGRLYGIGSKGSIAMTTLNLSKSTVGPSLSPLPGPTLVEGAADIPLLVDPSGSDDPTKIEIYYRKPGDDRETNLLMINYYEQFITFQGYEVNEESPVFALNTPRDSGLLLTATPFALSTNAVLLYLTLENLGSTQRRADVGFRGIVQGSEGGLHARDGGIAASLSPGYPFLFLSPPDGMGTTPSTFCRATVQLGLVNPNLCPDAAGPGDFADQFGVGWSNINVSAGSEAHLGLVLRFGETSSPPELVVASPSPMPPSFLSSSTISFSGSATTGSRILLVRNDDFQTAEFVVNVSGGAWTFDFPLSDSWGGDLHLTLYAVTTEGDVSAPVSFQTNVVPPTRPMTGTRGATPTIAMTRSPPYPSSTPFSTPASFPVIPDSNDQFKGHPDNNDTDILIKSPSIGVMASYEGSFPVYGLWGLPQIIGDSGVHLNDWSMTAVGSIAIVSVRLKNTGRFRRDVSLALMCGTVKFVLINPNDDPETREIEEVPVFDFQYEGSTGLKGFFALKESYRLNIFASGHPLGTNATAYAFRVWSPPDYRWYPQWNPSAPDLASVPVSGAEQGTEFEVVWNCSVPPLETLEVRAVLSWGPLLSGNPPTITGTAPQSAFHESGTPATISGTVTTGTNANVSIWYLIDDLGLTQLDATFSGNGQFDGELSFDGRLFASSWHSFSFFAIDADGRVSNPWKFNSGVIPVASPLPAQTIPWAAADFSITPVPSPGNFQVQFQGDRTSSVSGYTTKLIVEWYDEEVSAHNMENVTVRGVTLATSTGGLNDRSCPVVFTVSNSGSAAALVDVIVTAILDFGEESSPVTINNYPDLNGFVVGSVPLSFGVSARGSSEPGAVDTYWFGMVSDPDWSSWQQVQPWTQQTSFESPLGEYSEVPCLTLAWLRRVVPAGSSINLSFAFTIPPAVSLSGDPIVTVAGATISLAGSVSPVTAKVSFLVNYTAQGPKLVSTSSSGEFNVNIDLSAYLPETAYGDIVISAYAYDEKGLYSVPATKSVFLFPRRSASPKPPMTQSPISTLDPTASTTCDGLNYSATPTKLSVDGAGIVTARCVAQLAHTGLETVQIGKDVQEIGQEAFIGRTNLINFWTERPSALTVIGAGAFQGCSKLTTVLLPDGLGTIGEKAFAYTSLLSISIPSSVSSLLGAFYGSKISSFDLVGESSSFSVVDGVLYSLSKATLVAYPPQLGLRSFNVPNAVTEIGYGAFAFALNLVSVNLPNGLTQIRAFAFDGCATLASLLIPDSVLDIGDAAFRGCSALTYLRLSSTFNSLGSEVISGSGVSTVVLPLDLDTISEDSLQSSALTQSVYLLGTAVNSMNSGLCRALAAIVADQVTIYAKATPVCGSMSAQSFNSLPGDPTAIPSPSPPPSPMATASISALATADHAKPPIVIPALSVETGELLPDALIKDAPVKISGDGPLKAIGAVDLRVSDLVVAQDSNIVATALVVEVALELSGNCSLVADDTIPGNKITLREDVSLVFSAETIVETPVIRLGEIGTSYQIVPSQLKLNIGKDSGTKLAERRLLVSGKTLGNCDQWRAKLDESLPKTLKGVCDAAPAPGNARAIVQAGDELKEIGLYVTNRDTEDEPKNKDNTVIIVVVVVVVVVVVGVAVGVFFFLKKKGSASSSSKDSISA